MEFAGEFRQPRRLISLKIEHAADPIMKIVGERTSTSVHVEARQIHRPRRNKRIWLIGWIRTDVRISGERVELGYVLRSR
jgi:hypothetical protein